MSAWLRFAPTLLVFVLACSAPHARDAHARDASSLVAAPPPPPRVVLIALDGVRWQEIFHGTDPALFGSLDAAVAGAETAEELTPNLHALMRRGVGLGDVEAHSRLLATGPNFVSLPGYTEMLTGRPSECQENDCYGASRETLADAFRADETVGNDEVLVLSSWDVIGRVAARDASRIVVSSGRPFRGFRDLLFDRDDAEMSPLMSAAERSGPSPGAGDYRRDVFTHAIAVARFERLPRLRFAFIGLGDTDEQAHAGQYAKYLQAIRDADRLVGELRAISEGWGPAESARIMWFVTADHGRGPGFRGHGRSELGSDATWLVAAGGRIPALGALAWTSPHHLRDLAPTIRSLSGLPPVEGTDAGQPIPEIVLGAQRAAPPASSSVARP